MHFFDENRNILDEAFLHCDDVKCMDVDLQTQGYGTGRIYFVGETVLDLTLRQIKYGISDLETVETPEDMIAGVMNGNAVLLLKGKEFAYKVRSVGFPGLGVVEAKNEQVIRGSNEGFASSLKVNEVLLRKRIRSNEFKMEEQIYGTRTKTTVAFAYVETIARKDLLEHVKKKFDAFKIDGFMDSGVIEQLISHMTLSPFPQYMTTERPDRAVQFLLDGQIVILTDNSPVALVLPVSFATFLKTADDYFNRFELVTTERFLRYLAILLSTILPGLYIAIMNFHPEVLPVNLVENFIRARQGVPYSSLVEVLIMEVAFELIREAGVRIPGAMGSAVGIVGGLIIGSAAVEASIASPIVVILVAITALCSFSIPNYEFASAFRLMRYVLILCSAVFGIYGLLLGILGILIHLSGIENNGFAYIGEDSGEQRGDYIYRLPYKKMIYRPYYAKETNRRRMRGKW